MQLFLPFRPNRAKRAKIREQKREDSRGCGGNGIGRACGAIISLKLDAIRATDKDKKNSEHPLSLLFYFDEYF